MWITCPDFPGEQLVGCVNPHLEAGRTRMRESLLAATEADLGKIAAACVRARRPLRGTDKIAVRADRVLNRRKVAKHFTVDIGEDDVRYARDQDSIAAEARLDGIYVLRTSVAAGDPGSDEVASYQALAHAERVSRVFSTDLDIRPIRHRTEERTGSVRVCLQMLSCYLRWHMQARLARVLFPDNDKPAARTSPVDPARSPCAMAKAASRHTSGDLPVHGFAALLADLGIMCLNTIVSADPALPGFRLVTTRIPLQRQPSICSASATASGSRSKQPGPPHHESPVSRHTRGSLGELRVSGGDDDQTPLTRSLLCRATVGNPRVSVFHPGCGGLVTVW